MYRVKSGYERRNFLYLCDVFNFKHQVLELKGESSLSDDMIIKVWKPKFDNTNNMNNNHHFIPPTLLEILKKDGLSGEHRIFDGVPYEWHKIEKFLKILPERDLQIVTLSLLRNMSPYPSSSWALKFIDIFKSKNYMFPVGFLRALLSHCKYRNDVYGTLEVLYLAKEINSYDLMTNNNNNIKNYNNSTRASNNNDSYSSTYSDPSILYGRMVKDSELLSNTNNNSYNNNNQINNDKLDNIDWNTACNVAWFGHLHLNETAFEDSFNEVILLMRNSGNSLDAYSARILMRFLVKTQPESETTNSLFIRAYNDKSLILNHWENIALTILLTKLITKKDKYFLFRPFKRGKLLFYYYYKSDIIIADLSYNAFLSI